MDSIIAFLCEYAGQAHWIIFSFLMLAGLNFPMSEDILLISGGAIASLCIPEHTLRLYIWVFLGSWTSAWETYWLGRLLGPKLYKYRWFNRFINEKRVAKLHTYYERFGVFTFIVGRFIPGGVRNALFLSSGLGKMPFHVFILRDGFACFISTSVLFSLGYAFGQNLKTLIHYVETYNLVILSFLGTIFLIAATVLWRRRKTPEQAAK